MKYIFAGDSWALKGFTNSNYDIGNNNPMPGDIRLADYWGIEYIHCLAPGRGNLSVLDKLKLMPNLPIVWVYTEPGRDYGRITKQNEFDWIRSENIFQLREDLNGIILTTIRNTIPNPIALIGGLSDVDIKLANDLGYKVLCPSWQLWIAEHLNRKEYFKFGWGACDIGWRADYNNVKPSKAALFAWDELIKEWCMWEDLGYMCHEHPTPLANKEFAEYLKEDVLAWIKHVY
jgi:hypothetical protein